MFKNKCFTILGISLLFVGVSCNRSGNDVVIINPNQAKPAMLTNVGYNFNIIPLTEENFSPENSSYLFYDDYFFQVFSDKRNACESMSIFEKSGEYVIGFFRTGKTKDEYFGDYFITCFTKDSLLVEYNEQSTVVNKIPYRRISHKKHSYKTPDLRTTTDLADGRAISIKDHTGTSNKDLVLLRLLPDTVFEYANLGVFGKNQLVPNFYGIKFCNYKNPLVAVWGYNNQIFSIDNNNSLKLEFRFSFGRKGVPKDYASNNKHRTLYYGKLTDEQINMINQGRVILFDAPVKNNNVISLVYYREVFESKNRVNQFYVTDGVKSANYSELRIPGLIYSPRLVAVDGTSYVLEILDKPEIDVETPMSELGQQILDVFKTQKKKHPVLLSFQFKSPT